MKKFLLLTAGVLLLQMTKAQDGNNDPHFGVKLGANFTKMAFNPNLIGTDVNPKVGFAGGLTYTYPISSTLSIQPELLYSQMGTKVAVKNVGVTLDKGTFATNYLSIPIQLKIHAGSHFAFTVGPQLDIFLNSTLHFDHAGAINPHGFYSGLDYLGTAGVEWWPTYNLFFYGRYMHGFHNINYNLRDLNSETLTNKAYNRGIQVGLGWAFRHKPVPVVVAPPPPVIPDTDGDGIFDNVDKCPTVPGLAKYNGCPIPDTDKDGINDEQDKCPTTPGIAKYNGCPIPDTDNDGINDEEDKCPTVAGLAKYQGCPPPDRDNDGVIDEEDKCPDVAGPASNGGCPNLEDTKFNASMVQFATGTATLTAAAQKGLNEAAVLLNSDKFAPLKLSIEGHTDNTGKAASNKTLSEKRAAAVKTYLAKKGVSADRMTTVGYGQDQPVADNKTAAGRASNRRVEFKVSQ
jgi:outer membrane protein OmpA-like peptidoglycan-associated protein